MKTSEQTLSRYQCTKIKELISFALHTKAVSKSEIRTQLSQLSAQTNVFRLNPKQLDELSRYLCERIAVEVSAPENLFGGGQHPHHEEDDDDEEDF